MRPFKKTAILLGRYDFSYFTLSIFNQWIGNVRSPEHDNFLLRRGLAHEIKEFNEIERFLIYGDSNDS